MPIPDLQVSLHVHNGAGSIEATVREIQRELSKVDWRWVPSSVRKGSKDSA
ncbi:MAG: hypothetical protein ACLQU1_34295 [Bryobacteraceae bacterium]